MLIPVLPQGVTNLQDHIHHLQGHTRHHHVQVVRLPGVIVHLHVITQEVHHSAAVAAEGVPPEVQGHPNHRVPLRVAEEIGRAHV